MKINVKLLRPNPYRRMEQYPIDRQKLEALKTSINETSFWDNILARKDGKYFQIAYGHHRWIAIKELGIKMVDIPVRDLSDAMMLKIMAEENLNWSTSPAVVNETVLAAKEFLDVELKKCDSWDRVDKFIKTMFKSNSEYQNCRKNGVGRTTILKFLGANWKQWMVQEALRVLDEEKEGKIDRKAVESMNTVDQASQLRKSFGNFKVPKDRQQQIADKLREQEVPTKRINMTVSRCVNNVQEPSSMAEVEKLIEDIDKTARSLLSQIMRLRRLIDLLNVRQLKGVKTWLATCSLARLSRQMNTLRKDVTNETDS